MNDLLLFVISLVANFFSALAGGGAGLLQLPALLFLGLPFSVALATHKVASVFLGLGASARHFRSTRVPFLYLLWLLGFGLPGVWLGAQIILTVDPVWAQAALGVLTLGLGVYSWRQADLGLNLSDHVLTLGQQLFGALVLFGLGVLNGSLTSGSGLFVTLWLVRWFGLDYKTAIAYTLILVGLFWNGTGALALGLQGQIAWDWLPALILGSLLGGYLGAHLAIVKGNRLIKRSFEIVTILVGLSLLWKAWG